MPSQGTNTDGAEMTFWDHLEALRWVLFRIVIALFILIVGCFIAMPYIYDPFVLGPTRGDFFLYRWLGFLSHSGTHAAGSLMPDFGGDFHVDIININVATQFLTHISTSFWFALVLVFPYLMYEIWGFIKPALFPNEQKGIKTAFFFGSLLFYIGCAVGYVLVFPLTFRFLTTYHIGEIIVNQISMNSYMTNFLTIIFVMGLVFEIPILAWLLSALGLLRKPFLKKYRRHAIVILLCAAALITPSGDPFTLSVVFLPLFMLYEVSILIVKDEEPETVSE